MYPIKNFHAKKFQCLKLNTIFSTNGSKCMVKQSMTINFCHLVNYGFRQDYQFLSPFKNCIPTKIPCQTISVFEFEYTFFNQRKEMFVEEDYQFLPPFIKMYSDKYFHAKKFQCLKLNTLFSIKGGK